MTSSFAASLRKLADEAAEAKRLEEEKAREAERQAKAEAQRLKKQQETIVRQEARLAAMQVEREKRAKKAEAERVCRQEEIAKQAELARLEETRRKAEFEERRIREEAERARQLRLRKSQVCAEVYSALAVASWEGARDAAIGDAAFEFTAEFPEMGLQVIRRVELANLANRALHSWHKSVEKYLAHIDEGAQTVLSIGLETQMDRLLEKGNRPSALRAANTVDQICEEWLAQCRLAEENIHHSRALAEGCLERIGSIDDEREQVKALLKDAYKADKIRRGREASVREKIKAHADDIGSSYQTLLPKNVHPNNLSLGAKAAALRKAYATHILDVDFGTFSVNEIINFMRDANGLARLESGDEDPNHLERVRDGIAHDNLRQRMDRLVSDRERAKADIKQSRQMEKSALKNIDQFSRMLSLARSAQRNANNFLHLMESPVDGVEFSALKFADGKYVGPCFASLGSTPPVGDEYLQTAYGELLWLISGEGRDFSDYLDAVLSELAKQGERKVRLEFVEQEGLNRIEIGKVSLVCEIGSQLLALLFAKRGVAVESQQNGDGRVQFCLSW